MGLGARARRGMTSLDELLDSDPLRVAWNTSRMVAIDVDSVADAYQRFITVSKAAGICNVPRLVSSVASIFDNANLTVSKGASIFDSDNLSATKGASIFDNDNLTISKATSIFENMNLTVAKINDIIIDANIRDLKAGVIVANTDNATRDLTGATNISLAEIIDDWADNKLTSRDKQALSDSWAWTDEFYQLNDVFRPEWTTESGSPSASGGVLVLTAGDTTVQQVSIPTTFFAGAWEVEVQKQASGTTSLVNVLDWWAGGNEKYGLQWTNADNYKLQDIVDAVAIISATHAEDTSWHTCKATRDSSSNWEIFFDGVSDGTATDSTTTSIDEFAHRNGEDIEIHFDNLKIY